MSEARHQETCLVDDRYVHERLLRHGSTTLLRSQEQWLDAMIFGFSELLRENHVRNQINNDVEIA